jgi:transcription antitermination factor NusG
MPQKASNTPTNTLSADDKYALPDQHNLTCWYATYTKARHEKWVEGQMRRSGIECFLPTYTSIRRWKDRRKQLQLPLFPGYVFVRIASTERLRVLRMAGVVEFVTFHGKPATLPEPEIENMRNTLCRNIHAQPHPFLKAGRRVRVRQGPMQGVEGVLVRNKDSFRVVLSIELIMRSIALEVDIADVEALS